MVPTLVPRELIARLNRTRGKTRFTVKTGSGVPRPRPVFLVGALAGSSVFSSFTDCRDNVVTALLERVFYHAVPGGFGRPSAPTLEVVRGIFKRASGFYRNYTSSNTPVARVNFPSLYYRGRRLDVYERAVTNLNARGLRYSDSFLSTFIKHEKIEVSSKRAVPRVIQPRKPEYNVEVGRYIHHLEVPTYRMISALFGRDTVMKGLNAFQVGEKMSDAWHTYAAPSAVGLDASRFDQHVNRSLLEWEHMVYMLSYPSDPYLAMLLSWQLRNRGFARTRDGLVSYTVEGGRCSGDMNTALGNCLIMCTAVFELLYEHGLSLVGRSKVSLFNNGDDCVLMGEDADIKRVSAAVAPSFERLGIVMKVEPIVHSLEEVSFCQTQPVFDGARWRMVRDPRKSFSKDATILDPQHATVGLPAHLDALGKCGLSLCSGMPVLQEYYSVLVRNGRPGGKVDPRLTESGMYQLAKGLEPRISLVTPDARASFARAFGILPDLQVALEKELSVTPITGPVTLERTFGPLCRL